MVSARTESVSGHPSVHVGPEFDPSPSDARLFGQMMQKKNIAAIGYFEKDHGAVGCDAVIII